MGRPLSPAFGVEIREPSSGTFVLKCDQLAKCPTQPAFSNDSHAISPDVERRLRDFQRIVTMLRENVAEVAGEDVWDEDDEADDDFEEAYAL